MPFPCHDSLLPSPINNGTVLGGRDKDAIDRQIHSYSEFLSKEFTNTELEQLFEYLNSKLLSKGVGAKLTDADVNKINLDRAGFSSILIEKMWKAGMDRPSANVLAMELVFDARTASRNLRSPHVIELLEIDGIFQFPNRIARKNLIEKLRTN